MKGIVGFIVLLGIFQTGLGQNEENCRKRPLDVFFILDGSRSVTHSNFQVVKNYVKNFTDIFELGPDKVQIGVIQYGSLVKEEISLNEYHYLPDLLAAIDRIRYMAAGTMTGEALKYYVMTALQEEHGARVNNPAVHSIAIIITDGRSQDKTVFKWQRRAKERGVEIYAIGVGRKVNETELWEMASKPKPEHRYKVRDFAAIREIDVKIRKQIMICDVDKCGENLDDCDQICTNTFNSFVCSCNKGFVLQDDQKSCLALLIPNPSSIYVDDITHTTAVATWEIDNEQGFEIDHFELKYVRSDGNGIEVTENVFDETTYNIVDLDSSTMYNVSVRAVGRDGSMSETVSTTFTTLVLGQTTVKLIKPTLSTLTAEWTPAGGDGLTGYEVIYREVLDLNGGGVEPVVGAIVERVGPDVHSKVLQGLRPGSLYDVTVIPLYGDLAGTLGTSELSTDTLETPSVEIVSSGLTTLTSRWSEINYQANSWVVDIRNMKTNETMTFNVGNEDLYKVFSNLIPETEYMVFVTGIIDQNGELFSSPAGETIGQTGKLTPPKVIITDTSLSTITAEWTEINIPVSLWVIGISNEQTGEYEEFTKEATILENRFLHLTPSTEYKVHVRAKLVVNSVEIESPVAIATAKTKTLFGPDVEITQTGVTSLEVEWTNINFNVDSWHLTYFPKGEKEQSRSIAITGTGRFATLIDLTPSTRYIIKVVGHVMEGSDIFVSPVGKTAGSTVPLPPRNIEVIDQTVFSLTSTFDPSLSITTRYVATCTALDNGDVIIGFVTNFKINCQNLVPATCYSIQVYSVHKKFKSETLETKGCTKVPAPTNMIVVEPTPSSLLVTWERPDPLLIDYYELNYQSVTNSDDNGKLKIESDQNRYVLVNLQPDTEYDIELVGVKDNRTSATLWNQGTTLTEYINTQVTGIGLTSFNVSWETSVVPHLQFYELNVTGPNVSVTYDVVPPVINYEITLLQPNTTYEWAVTAIYSKSTSPTTTKHTTTLEMPTIGPMSFSNVTESSMVVHWEHDDDVMLVDFYVVTYRTVGSSEKITINNVKEKNIRLNNLSSTTPYNVTVQAVYPNNMISKKIYDIEITEDLPFADITQASCSCSTYLNSQEQMQSAIMQLVKSIDGLTKRIDKISVSTSQRSRRSKKHPGMH